MKPRITLTPDQMTSLGFSTRLTSSEIALKEAQVDNILTHLRAMGLGCDSSLTIKSNGEIVLQLGKHISIIKKTSIELMFAADLTDLAETFAASP